MGEFIFHVQWWIPALLAVLGVALFLNGNKVRVDRLRNAGLGLVGLAIVWPLVSFFVDTAQEKVENSTHAAILAVVEGKWDVFKNELTPGAQFTISSSSTIGAESVTAIAKAGAEGVKLRTARVQNLTMEQAGTVIRAHFDILSTQDGFAPIETSTWEFEWEETANGWKIRELKLLKLKDVDNLDGINPQRFGR
jgi:hypothetical protein